jgi:6-phosphogluconolactonase
VLLRDPDSYRDSVVLRGKKNNQNRVIINHLEKIVKIFPDPYTLAKAFAEEMICMIERPAQKGRPFSVALSGGSTPEVLFALLSENYAKSVSWKFVHFFWADERCVSPDDQESNYGMTQRKLLCNIDIPSTNIHRIKGEEDPEYEVLRYSDEISEFTDKRDGLPLFDLVILGLGEDGHTASIFPGHRELIYSDRICDVAVHPVTFQKRITLTGRVINNAGSVAFLVTGKKKEKVVEKILKKGTDSYDLPASYIVPVYGPLSWFLDREAGGLL